MSLNIVLDSDIVLDLLNLSQNDTQYAFSRLQKSPTQFWIPCCLLAILETQILPTRHHPLDKIVPQVKLLSCLAEHWHLIPPLHKNKIQALISLDAANLKGNTIVWTNNEDFNPVHPDIECGDIELVYAMLAEHS